MRDADESFPDLNTPDALDRLFEPLKRYSHAALAVSGGPDSLSLMMLACRWSAGCTDAPTLSVLTVDHGLRDAAKDEAGMVCGLAKRLGLACEILNWQGAKPDSGVQNAARQARYALMTTWCRDNRAQALVLAHTRDDQSETVLMRFLRGSGVDGLSAMAQTTEFEGVDFVRPLLGVEKRHLVALLKREHVSPAADPSNQDTRFERVQIRDALTVLESYGLRSDALVRTSRRMESAREALEHFTDLAMADCVTWSPRGYCEIGTAAFAESVREIGLRVLSRCLSAIGGQSYPCNWDALNRLYEKLVGEDKEHQTLHHCLLRPGADTVMISRETGSRSPEPVAIEPGDTLDWDNRFRISLAGDGSRRAEIGALEADGWRQIKDRARDLSQLPSAVRHALPALRLSDGTILVPHSTCAGLDEGVMVKFTDRGLLRGAVQKCQ